MSKSNKFHGFRKECIVAEKVYDWVILNKAQTFTGLAFDSIGETPVAGSDLTVIGCEILQENGTDTECFAADDSVDMDVELPNGKEIELQLVTIMKTLEVEVTYVVTGTTMPEFTATATVNLIPEQVLLCRPDDIEVVCDILPSSTCDVFNLTLTTVGATVTGDLIVNVCQSVQAETEVKLEVFAKFCEPRDLIPVPSAACRRARFPEQCPEIFPNHRDKKRRRRCHDKHDNNNFDASADESDYDFPMWNNNGED
ncbi:hypothetical protein [Halobacillus seohaensis]|uniref:DUF3794 domain-containing protein n=1 Tax=Halobacillus seohaensis TaxID=447421 RepID=A0ABW2ESG2_9BACI